MNGRLGRVTEAQVRHELLREADRTARRLSRKKRSRAAP